MILCDSAPLVAAAASNEEHHHACVELFTGLRLAGRRLPVPQTVVAVIALAERLGVTEIATLDRRHFTVVRPRHVSALTLLPE